MVLRIPYLFGTLAVGLLGLTSCRLNHNALQTSVIEPAQYPRNVYDKMAHHRFSGLANCALDQVRAVARAERDDYCSEPFTPDHECGFVDGYVDYLEAGGTGSPPVLPPRRYWRAKYQTPGGQQCVQDWFRGYEHGAAVARDSNYRSLVTIPVSDAVTDDTIPYLYGRIIPASQLESVPAGKDEEDRNESGEDVRYATRPEGRDSRTREPKRPTRPESQPTLLRDAAVPQP